MGLIKSVEKTIRNEYKSIKLIKLYIEKWYYSNHDQNLYSNDYWENFSIALSASGTIDLTKTLHSMSGSDLIKVAIDLGIDTPDFIPTMPSFRNELKSSYETAYDTLSKAWKMIESDPSTAIGLANSSFESIIKEILKDSRISINIKGNETLYKLTNIILSEFKLTGESLPIEIRTIGSSFIAINQAIENLRSSKTNFHGKTSNDYIIQDSIYAYLVINSIATVGIFLISYYKNKYPKKKEDDNINDFPF